MLGIPNSKTRLVTWKMPSPTSVLAPEKCPQEQALQLPRSFVLGGDPPKAYLAGKEVGKLPWRPLLEVSLMLGGFFPLQNQNFRRRRSSKDNGYVVIGNGGKPSQFISRLTRSLMVLKFSTKKGGALKIKAVGCGCGELFSPAGPDLEDFWQIAVKNKKPMALPETNIAPENRPLEKKIPIGNHHC